MTPAAPLLLMTAAIAEWFISLRSLGAIAQRFEIEPEKLQQSFPQLAHPHTFRGQLEAALATPPIRPDLIPQRIHLARLEEQLMALYKQRDRAEERIERMQSHAEGFDDAELMKAEVFANRVHQQGVKLLKEIEKLRQELEKAAAQPPSVPGSASCPDSNSTSNSVSGAVPAALMDAAPSEASETLSDTTAVRAKSEITPLAAAAANIPISPPPTEQEFLTCVVSNRERLETTPANDRQKLVARLIEEQRAKTKARAA